jgi:hypothetical protein
MSSRRSRLLIAAFILITAVAGFLWLQGSAVVIDDTGQVASAVITDGGSPPTDARLYRLWNGYFYGVPRFEGTIEVRCRNGARKQWGYVIHGLHTRVRLVGQTPCQQAVLGYRHGAMEETY